MLAKNTFSIEYKKFNGATVILTMGRGRTNLTLQHHYSSKVTQNLIETAQLCGDLETMNVDDSLLQIQE